EGGAEQLRAERRPTLSASGNQGQRARARKYSFPRFGVGGEGEALAAGGRRNAGARRRAQSPGAGRRSGRLRRIPGFAACELRDRRSLRSRRGSAAMSTSLPARFDLSGKVAVVTGGGGLLGEQHALALAEVGAHVVLADIDPKAAARAAQNVN